METDRIELVKFAAAVLGALVVLAVFEALRRRLGQRIAQSAGHRLAVLERRSAGLITEARVVWGAGLVGTALRFAVWIVALLFIAQRALVPFPATREFGVTLAQLVRDPIETLAFDFVRAIPGLVFVAVVVAAAVGAVRLSRGVFDRLGASRIHLPGFYPEWATPTHRLVTVSVIAIAAVVAYPYIPGSSSEAFKGVTVFVGLVVSLGSSSIIGNLLNGFVITYMRAFRLGDVIKIGDTVGQVMDLTLLVTRVRTVQGLEITIPNTQVLSGQVTNYTKEARGKDVATTSLSLTIGYDVAWRTVHELLISAASQVPQVKQTPPPYVIQRGMLDHAISYELFFVIGPASELPVLWSRVSEQVLDAFNAAGIQIMSPRYMMDPAAPKVVRETR